MWQKCEKNKINKSDAEIIKWKIVFHNFPHIVIYLRNNNLLEFIKNLYVNREVNYQLFMEVFK